MINRMLAAVGLDNREEQQAIIHQHLNHYFQNININDDVIRERYQNIFDRYLAHDNHLFHHVFQDQFQRLLEEQQRHEREYLNERNNLYHRYGIGGRLFGGFFDENPHRRHDFLQEMIREMSRLIRTALSREIEDNNSLFAIVPPYFSGEFTLFTEALLLDIEQHSLDEKKRVIALIIGSEALRSYFFLDKLDKLISLFPEDKERLAATAEAIIDGTTETTYPAFRKFLGFAKHFPELRPSMHEKLALDQAENYRKYIHSDSDLVAAAESFPELKDALIKPILTDSAKREQLAREYRGLARVAACFPEHQKALLTVCLGTPEDHKKYITCVNALATLGKAFSPEFHDQILLPVLNDPEQRRELLDEHFYDLITNVGKAFPNHQSVILQPILDNPDHCNTLITLFLTSASRIQTLTEAFPQYQEELYTLTVTETDNFAQIDKTCSDFISLCQAFPSHQAELVDLFLNDSNARQRVIHDTFDFRRIAKNLPQLQATLFESILTDDRSEWQRLVRNYSDLNHLKEFAPEYEKRLIAPLLESSEERKRIIKSTSDLTILCKKFPTAKAALLETVLSDRSEWQRVVHDTFDLERLQEFAPEYEEQLLAPLLESSEERKRIIKSTNGLISICKKSPSAKAALLETVLSDRSEWQRVVPDTFDLKRLQEFAPEHEKQLIAPLLESSDERKRIIISLYSLTTICEAFSNYKDELCEKFFSNPDEVINIIEFNIHDDSNLPRIFVEFPKYKDTIQKWIVTDVAFLSKLIENNVSNFYSALKCFPQEKNRIVKALLENGDIRKIFTCLENIKQLFREVPDLKDTILDDFFNDREWLQRYDSRRSVRELLHRYPEKHKLLLAYAASVSTEFFISCIEDINTNRLQSNDLWEVIRQVIDIVETVDRNKSDCYRQLDAFKQAYEKSNSLLTAFQKMTFDDFLRVNHTTIISLIITLKPQQALTLLTTMAEKSSLFVKNFLRQQPSSFNKNQTMLLQDIIGKYSDKLADKSSVSVWQDIFSALATITSESQSSNRNRISPFSRLLEAMKSSESLIDIPKLILDTTLAFQIKTLGISTSEPMDSEKSRLLTQSKHFPHLLATRGKADGAYYSNSTTTHDTWLRSMLACDFTSQSLDDLLHNVEQENPTMCKVAEHNKAIRETLKAGGINVDQAMNYKKSLPFTYTEKKNKAVDWQKEAKAILSALQHLVKVLNTPDLLNDNLYKGMNKSVKSILTQLTKGKNHENDLAKRIQSEAIGNLLDKLSKKLSAASKREKPEGMNAEQHPQLTQAMSSMQDAINNLNECKKAPPEKRFRVVQWDKSRSDTFLLGNYVDCCLSAGGSYFKAIVERRLDDAMPIHVVLDEETNKPVCAAWLFYAKDENDGKIKLVANFYEINNGHTRDKALRDTLVSHLQYFSGDMYLKDVGISQMVMRPLTYGNIPDLYGMETVECNFQHKIGGYCPSALGSNNTYYLESINRRMRRYHHYTHKGLKTQYSDIDLPKEYTPAPDISAVSLFSETGKKKRKKVRVKKKRRVSTAAPPEQHNQIIEEPRHADANRTIEPQEQQPALAAQPQELETIVNRREQDNHFIPVRDDMNELIINEEPNDIMRNPRCAIL